MRDEIAQRYQNQGKGLNKYQEMRIEITIIRL